MGENSGIEWTDHTWNPWQGCHKVSAGCKNCYMYREKKHYGQEPAVVVRSKDPTFHKPLRWREPAYVFTCSWSDFFIEEADPWRGDAWDVMRRTPHLTYQVLTKRPENIADRLPEDWGDGWDNVWLGVSVESTKYVDRITQMMQTPASVYFVSFEPLLDDVVMALRPEHCQINWAIAGGESGPGYRPCKPDWVRALREWSLCWGIPFFFKQWGGMAKIGVAWGGNLLDGRTWNEMPTRHNSSSLLTQVMVNQEPVG